MHLASVNILDKPGIQCMYSAYTATLDVLDRNYLHCTLASLTAFQAHTFDIAEAHGLPL